MKKYTQIALVVVVLAILVFVRQMKSGGTQMPVATPQGTPSPESTASPTAKPQSQSQYKDGTYTGSVEDAFYGNFQVAAVITNGKLSDIQFLQYPSDKQTSKSINEAAIPILRSEAIQAQSAQVDIVSSASQSSDAFKKSLNTALQHARS